MSSFANKSDILPNVATAIAAIPALFGIIAILAPRVMLTIAEFPHPKTPDAQKLAHNLLRMFGSRGLVVGLLVFAIRLRGDRELLGWAMLLTGLMPLADGLVSVNQIGGGLMKHCGIIPVIFGVAAGLLGWLG